MTALPIVGRELLVQSRRPATFRIRTAFALVLGAIAALVLMMVDRNREASDILLWLNSSLALGWCLLSGAILTVDCLGGEQREGTLELLFLTDLTRADIVLGKLAASALQAGFGLFAVLPILAVPLLIGGVSPGQFWRLVLVLLATQFWSLSLGVLVSSVTVEIRAAVSRVVAILAAQGIGVPLLGWVLGRSSFPGADAVSRSLGLLSPVNTFDLALTRRMAGAGVPEEFGWGVAVLFGLGLASLAIASLRLPRLLETQAKAGATSTPPGRGMAGQVPARHPYSWLIERHPRADALGKLLGLGLLLWVAMHGGAWLAGSGRDRQWFIISFLLAYGLHLLVKLRALLEATRQLGTDAGSGGLELLLSTPLAPESILRDSTAALWRRCQPDLLKLTAVNLLLWLQTFKEGLAINRVSEHIAFSTFFLGGAVLLWLDARALIPLAMLTALRYRRPWKATIVSAAWLFVPGWTGMLFVFLLATQRGSSERMALLVTAWWAAGVAISQLLRIAAGSQLRAFRSLAAGEVMPR